MKNNKLFLGVVLSTLTASLLLGCNNQSISSDNKNKSSNPIISSIEEEDEPLEIGDTVKEWTDDDKFDTLPMALLSGSNNGVGEVKFERELGKDDNCSLLINAKVGNNNQCTISSDAVEKLFFTEEDAKNGDIVSLFYYVPNNSNLASIQLELISSNNESVPGRVIEIDDSRTEEWIKTPVVSFDSLYTLGSIRLTFKAIDPEVEVKFYIDNINITLGEETVDTDYVYNDESLYQTYEDYFKVGTCMSANMLKNTTLRKILKNDFNSVTAENEGKPEQVLDQAGCQEAAKTNNRNVRITTKPFEKLYDFAEASHIGVRHHTFVWYSQTPAWFFTEDYTQNGKKASRELMLARMENFIQVTLETINSRWPELVYAIDVANEAIDNGIRKNNNNWYSTVGEDFVYYAFKFADKYKEDYQELYYNDYSYDYNRSNCDFALNTLLKDVIDENLIDGVGIQGHIDDDQNMDNVIYDAQEIYKRGLKCQITELDVETRGNGDNKWEKQKNAYKLLIKKVLESNAKEETDINAVIVWGITDDASWKRQSNPLLFTSSYAKKPAYYGFLEAIDEFEE